MSAPAEPAPGIAPFPGHDAGAYLPVTARVAASWPTGHFAENLAVDAVGRVAVSLHSHSLVVRYDPADGSVMTLARMPEPVAGLAFDRDGTLWASGGVLGQLPGFIWRIGADGAVDTIATVADAVFLNGLTPHPDGRLLVAESVTGHVLAVDRSTGTAATWLNDERLRPTSAGVPGANGLKLFGGHAYVSVTDRNLILRAPLAADGTAGPLETVAADLRADDFAFACDGALFIATHPANSVLRLDPDGTRTTIAGPAEGVVGATAVAFGRAEADAKALYVTTNGGLWSPFEGAVQPAKLVRMDVGASGYPLLDA